MKPSTKFSNSFLMFVCFTFLFTELSYARASKGYKRASTYMSHPKKNSYGRKTASMHKHSMRNGPRVRSHKRIKAHAAKGAHRSKASVQNRKVGRKKPMRHRS